MQKNFALKVFSVALAVAGWAYFRFAANPVLSSRLDQQFSVPITLTHLPLGYVAKYAERDALVTVAAPKRGAAPMKPDEVKAVLDLQNRTTGVYNIPVTVVAPNVVIQSLSPASVTLTVEKVDQKSFPLALHYRGAESRAVVASTSSITPAHVQVRGAADDLSRVTAVHVDVPLAASPSAFDAMVRPIAVDVRGAEIPFVQVAPNLVRVRVKFVAANPK